MTTAMTYNPWAGGKREKQKHTWLRFPCLSLPVFQPSVQAWLVLSWLMLYPI